MHYKDYTHFEDLEVYKSGSESSFINNDTEPELFD